MPNAPSYRATVAALALGQLLTWAALFYGFSSFVLPMQRELGWDKPTLMGAYTLGLAVWGGAAFAIGAAIDRGRGRAVMTWGAAAGGIGCLAWSQVSAPWMFYAVWALLGVAMAATLYERGGQISPRARRSATTCSMPTLSIRRSAAFDTRSRTQRLSLSSQNRRDCRLGNQRRLVLLLACETLCPTIGRLPVT